MKKERIRNWWYGSPPRLSDVYAVLVKYDDVTRYEGPYVNSGHRDFLADYQTGEALPLLSIGQMIELIEVHLVNTSTRGNWTIGDLISDIDTYKAADLCDVLWEETKNVLRN